MKTFNEFLSEGADPLESKLSGGRGDNPALAGKKEPDNHKQINDKLKTQNNHMSDFIKKIKPIVTPLAKQMSPNITATNGTKTAGNKQ